MLKFFRRFSRARGLGRLTHSRFRPVIHCLEDRLTPATSTISGGVLTLNYTATGNTSESVAIANNGTNIVLTGTVTGDKSAPIANVNKIVVQDTSGGTNQVLILAGVAPIALSNDLSVSGMEIVSIETPINVTGSASLSIAATTRILVGGDLSSQDGDITLQANQQLPATSGSFIAIDFNDAEVASKTGDILVQGRAGDAVGINQPGVQIRNGSVIGKGTTGPVTIVGVGGSSGGNNIGVLVTDHGSSITSGGGAVSVTGTAGNTGSFAVTLQTGGLISSGGSGDVTIVADSLNVDGTSSVRAGTASDRVATIRPRTAGTKIDLGGSDVLSGSPLVLGITDDEIQRITAGTLKIGDANSGPLTLSSAINRSGPAFVLTSGAAINLAASINTSDSDLTLIAGDNINQTGGMVITRGTLSVQAPANKTVTFTTANNRASHFAITAGTTALVNGSFLSSTTVDVSGTLGGSGSVGPVTVLSGGRIAPGTNQLTTGDINFKAGSSYSIGLNAAVVPLNVVGKVTIDSATLSTIAPANPRLGQVFKLIDNNSSEAVTGTFNGLPSGSTISIGGFLYTINYKSGDGNDITLVAGVPLSAVGAGPGGGPAVTIRNADQSVRFSFFAYDAGFTGGVRVATGDVNGDGFADFATAPGVGGGPHIKIYDGKTGSLLSQFFAYDPKFAGGVFIALADIDGDGKADVITGAGAGGAPHVRAFDASGKLLREFYAYGQGFAGGVNVAGGDIDGDGKADIITGAGPGGTPHVRVFSGASNAVLREFLAFADSNKGGVTVAAGDVNGDGKADIVTGEGPSDGSRVRVYSGANNSVLRNFIAYDSKFKGGVYVASADLNSDGRAELITGSGAADGFTARLRWFDGRTNDQILDQTPYATFFGGIFVG